MTKEFETRIQKERIVDTKIYRYVYECDFDKAVIKRLPKGTRYHSGTNRLGDCQNI